MSDASELLAAGAVLPLGTEDAGESAVLLTARTYRHPALDDRVLVRLTAADLGLGEDQVSGYLGMERVGEPAEVGFGRRAVLGFPEWVLARHPEDGHHALAVIPEMQKIDQCAKNKPKAALDAFRELAGRLASSVPHLLPTYYERAARTFLSTGNTVYAAQMFTHARRAEAEHALAIDDERHDAVFLEFALAGVLPVKALSGYAKELTFRVSAEEALRRFTRLCVRRTAGGLPPSAQMALELPRLARAAGEDAEAVEHDYLAELLVLPATARAAAGWWKAHRPALASLAARRPELRGTLLNMMPVSDESGRPAREEALAGIASGEVTGPSDGLLKSALNGLGHRWDRGGRDGSPRFFGGLQVLAKAMEAGLAVDPERRARIHLDGPELPESDLQLDELLEIRGSVLYRAVTGFHGPEHREALRELLTAFAGLGLGTGVSARWRRFELILDDAELKKPDGTWRGGSWKGLLPLGGGAFLVVLGHGVRDTARVFPALFHDPAGLFEVPAPYTVRSSDPVVSQDAVPREAFLAEAAERGPAPWFPGAAEEFSRLTGTTRTTAGLIIAGLPSIDSGEHDFLTPELRTLLEVKVAEAAFARDGLRWLKVRTRRELLTALLPADPARLWTDGPDVAAAAEAWNAEFGRRVAVPEEILAEAAKAVRTGWDADYALPALLEPASEPKLSRDLKWVVREHTVVPEDIDADGFDACILRTSVAVTAWAAHRLPAGDPLRERLPAALAAVRERLANPDLMLVAGDRVDLPGFRRAAGAPTETGQGFERYGAVIMPTHDDLPWPAIRTALLEETGSDPYLTVLGSELPELAALQCSWRTALDDRFAALLADPGDPAAGERGSDGTWWPQDPSRSVPEPVAEAAERYGLGADAAAVYLMLLAMPDPTDRNTARWTGWKPARLKAARAELAATDLVIEARRSRAGRSLFLPGGWAALRVPHLPQEEWKLPLYDLADGTDPEASHGVIVPFEPVADLYRRAWRRVVDGDVPRFADLEVRRGRRR